MLSWGEVLIPMHVNVGPGCSSVGVGAFSENGPFRPSGKVLARNEYSWNKGEDLSCKWFNVAGPGRCRANLFFLGVCVQSSANYVDAFLLLLFWWRSKDHWTKRPHNFPFAVFLFLFSLETMFVVFRG
jgi:hypothetical protein